MTTTNCDQCGDCPECNTLDAAVSLLTAAITFRDLCDAMRPDLFVAMPSDLRNRITSSQYQDAFDQLPERVRAQAADIVLADPDIVEARRLDAEYRAERGR
jgi:DNA-binding cell septation regulator SpoVG